MANVLDSILNASSIGTSITESITESNTAVFNNEQELQQAQLSKYIESLRNNFLGLLEASMIGQPPLSNPVDKEEGGGEQQALNKSFEELRTATAAQTFTSQVCVENIVQSGQGLMTIVTKLKMAQILHDGARKHATVSRAKAALNARTIENRQHILQLSREVTAATNQVQQEYLHAKAFSSSWL
eukprot:gb/GEZN01018840.1/.p1 GENE.gb/GEZN01018840.1/~~gb/GEZN01018840.1/.p1  ORF type:complete len:185 (+),score=31.59 gb/GEZN01018840.1/:22-576(+)